MKFTSYSFKRLLSPAIQFLVFIGLATFFVGCQWGDEITALDQSNPDDFMVLFSDTSAVAISTVRFDSVMTGGPARMLVGRYEDPYLGKMHATTFFQPTLQAGVTIPAGAVYDSLILSMLYEKTSAAYPNRPYVLGDTTKLMTFTAHALKADILSKSSYYNHNVTAFDSVPLGRLTFFPRPYSGQRITMKLSNALGQKIFDTAKANLLNNNEQWIEILKGLMVVSRSTDNGSIIGFRTVQDSSAVELHYHTTGTDDITKTVSYFKVSAAYNQILGDRSKTPLASLPAARRNALPSASSGEKTYIQEGTGIMTRIDIPNIKSLKDIKYSVSNRAFLRITPIKQSVTHFLPAPPIIHLYLCDKNNEFVAPLQDLQAHPVTGRYIVDLINNTEYYSFDVSKYVTDLLNSEVSQNLGLLMVTGELGSQVQDYPEGRIEVSQGMRRLVIGSQKNTSDRGIKLELYYTTVKAQTK